MYTTRSDRPLDPVTRVILATLHAVAMQHDASYFIIGATARDILLTHVFGIEPERATRDVDFAIALAEWRTSSIC
jgi:predicted nucleotidyltransferase